MVSISSLKPSSRDLIQTFSDKQADHFLISRPRRITRLYPFQQRCLKEERARLIEEKAAARAIAKRLRLTLDDQHRREEQRASEAQTARNIAEIKRLMAIARAEKETEKEKVEDKDEDKHSENKDKMEIQVLTDFRLTEFEMSTCGRDFFSPKDLGNARMRFPRET